MCLIFSYAVVVESCRLWNRVYCHAACCGNQFSRGLWSLMMILEFFSIWILYALIWLRIVCTIRSAPPLLWWLYRCDCCWMISHGGFSIMTPFDCTIRYDILWRWLTVWLNDDFWMSELWQPCEGRRDNVRILFAFDQNGGCPSCACTHVDSDHEVEMWLSLLCASNCVMSVKVISALRLNADVTPRHRRVMQQVVFLDLVLARLTRSW